MNRLLILGCGYVGSAVAWRAVDEGREVTAVTRNPERAAALAATGVHAVVADLAESDWHGQVGREFETVLNCVGSGGSGMEGYRRSYLEGMKSVLVWARSAAVGTLVYTSSTSVYAQDAGVRVDESMPAEGRNETAQILVETEKLLRNAPAAERANLRRWFILRLAGIYGPERHSLLDAIRIGYTSLPGTGGHRLNLAHRDDIVDAIFACFEASPAVYDQVFNVADDAPATKHEVAVWLASQLGKTAPVLAGGLAPGRSAAVPDRIIANGRIKEALGWSPVHPTFREGYAEILQQESPQKGAEGA
jgi:nucleoside-diphosphate-sugar epimerase